MNGSLIVIIGILLIVFGCLSGLLFPHLGLAWLLMISLGCGSVGGNLAVIGWRWDR